MSTLKILGMMADEIESLRDEGVEHHLILTDVVADLQRLAAGGTSMLAAAALQRRNAAPAKNEPDTNQTTSKSWEQTPVGWFVQAPKSTDWYEVMETRAMHSGLQLVTLRAPDGRTVETQRPADQHVTCCPGTLSGTAEVAEALDLFGEGAQILKDEVD